jgi:hypothetical protein
MADSPSSPRQPEEEIKVDGERFDALLREVASPTSRRRIVGGVLGGVAALVAGTAVIKAKPGNGKGGGQTKVEICHHSNGHGGKYKKLRLGAPGAENHLANHDEDGLFGGCCPGDTCEPSGPCVTAECTGTENPTTGTTTFACAETPVLDGTPCDVDPAVEEECVAGACVPVTP